MANALYNPFKEYLIDAGSLTPGGVDLNTQAIKATLVDSADYTFGAAHSEYDQPAHGGDIVAAAKVAESATLGSPTVTSGVFDTADFTWTSVSGDESEAIIVWNDGITAPITDLMMAFYDTGMSGMPVTPNSGDINVTVNGSGWFAL